MSISKLSSRNLNKSNSDSPQPSVERLDQIGVKNKRRPSPFIKRGCPKGDSARAKRVPIWLPGVKRNILLKKHTTFRIGGPAKYFFAAKTKEEIIKAIKWARENNLPFFILGGGSNLLVSDKGYEGLVINFQFSIFNFQTIFNSKISKIIVGAGLPLTKLVSASVEKGLTGLEWAAGIPGTVGGAVYGNAGAFGYSMADAVKSVEVLDVRNFKFKISNLKNCKFGYRGSIFKRKKNLIILSAEIELKKGKKKEIKKKIKEHLDYRKQHHPQLPSAGSVFKNPAPSSGAGRGIGVTPAAILIHQAGLTGKKIGNTQISEKHSNFIVNLGNGKAKDVKKLINLAKKSVKKKFGIVLEEEIQYLP